MNAHDIRGRPVAKAQTEIGRSSALARTWSMLMGSLFLGWAAPAKAQFTFTTNAGAIVITGYTGTAGVVTIPDATNGLPVTGIASGAFQNMASLTSITIPGSVTNIAANAFQQCAALTNATLSSGVTALGADMFNGCSSLTTVSMADSVTNVGDGAFYGATSLPAITIPGSVSSIGQYAFYDC